MTNKLTENLIDNLKSGLSKDQKTGIASMNFVGHIQSTNTANRDKALARLKYLETNQLVNGDEEAEPVEVEASEEDFVTVTFRALSAAMLADRAIDFSKDGVLRRSTKMLNGQTVFKDHETSVDNWVGRVIATFWDTKTEGLPPGINADLQLDMVKDPMAVRGVLQGAIHSASVTVSFQWVPSHPQLMEDGSFFSMLGEEVDGEIVRVVVTKIDKFMEISLVWQGADEFAKQIDDEGNPVGLNSQTTGFIQQINPGISNGNPDHFQTLTTTETWDSNEIIIPDTEYIDSGSFVSEDNTEYIDDEQNLVPEMEDDMDKKLQAALKSILGVEVSQQNIVEVLKTKQKEIHDKALSESDEKYEALVKDLKEKGSKSEERIEELEAKVAELKDNAELGAKYLENERSEAARLYKLAKGEAAKEVILKTLSESTLEIVQAWKEEFQAEADQKMPAKCANCESTEITRQSSKVSEDDKERLKTQASIKSDGIAKVRNLHS